MSKATSEGSGPSGRQSQNRGDLTARSARTTTSAGRSEDSALTANIGASLDELLFSGKAGKNPYLFQQFTGSKEQTVKCPYCSGLFFNTVNYTVADGVVSSSPVVCLHCGEIVSGII